MSNRCRMCGGEAPEGSPVCPDCRRVYATFDNVLDHQDDCGGPTVTIEIPALWCMIFGGERNTKAGLEIVTGREITFCKKNETAWLDKVAEAYVAECEDDFWDYIEGRYRLTREQDVL